MPPLNNISILFSMNKNQELEHQIKDALVAWNKRKETRDNVPESIVFNFNQTDITDKDRILDLTVLFRKDVQKNHFKIEGKLY